MHIVYGERISASLSLKSRSNVVEWLGRRAKGCAQIMTNYALWLRATREEREIYSYVVNIDTGTNYRIFIIFLDNGH